MLASFDAVLLARIQFAFTVSFHFLFPAFTIGLASYLAVLNGLWLWTKDHKYLDLFRYWVKIFALAFAMGVVSGIVMSYQFGTNWSVFSDKAGPVIGAPMAYEVLSAFFLEAGFLGIMLFGREKVGPTLHMVATAMVALGTFFSAFWILSVNSWMQTPAGFSIDPDTGQFLPENFWEIIFNPSFPYRLMHTVTAAYLTTAFIVGGVAAFHLLRRRRRGETPSEATRTMFSMAMWMAAIVAPIQIFLGDLHGINTLEHQPAKVMAMEGHYESHPEGAPLYLFGIPNDETQTLDYAVGIPKLSSLILKHDLNAPLAGLDTIPDDEQPPVGIVFWSFRVMVALGFAMLGLGAWSLYARWKGRLFEMPWLHRAALAMAPSGLIAVLAGWITTEVGRQPYTVYGMLRTSESAAPLDAAAVGTSLVAFIVVYFAVFGAGTFYILRLMSRPPVFDEPRLKDVTKGPIRTAGITPAIEETMRRPDAAHPGE
ncbi:MULTISPECIES: cytochrome ubiquinol oxidase subunit I [unclassified Paracoccus (in: a-proteobacteria)]|uniref:cytochrome ubiquinol oxidase subunit I n=1 Tax=unclassified Paracoccus (in: a-proteobacteria) TaxID=2688777 RepID=UPI001F38E8C2|nr:MULTISPECIES: cytochrome ubiquinol oxidase subunit I [unclassified Paracoccus (in: a-proteobacteria)]QXO85698.1 Cytochrome bd ubiquinol oxidase subunit 1 [Paracoccus sp. (in: a-proteobacteria)]